MAFSRRRLLRSAPVLPIAALAGCASVPTGASSPTPTPSYEHLESTAIYTADDVGLRVPERIGTVDTPTAADLVVIHGNPAVEVDRVVSWLADGRAVALLGDRAQSTWNAWVSSDPYRDAFGSGGRSESEPAPHLLVAAASSRVSTYRYSWGDLPRNDEILRALDEAMRDIAARTPR